MALPLQQARVLERSDKAVRFYDVGDGPAVLLIHGWALDARVWVPLVEHLTTHFRVVSVDRRGSARSSAAPDLVADAEDLVALLDYLSIRRAIVVGMSQGARVALNLFATAEERFAGLVFDGPAPDARVLGDDWPQDVDRIALAQTLATAGVSALRAAVASHPLMQLHNPEPSVHQLLANLLADYRGIDLQAQPAHEAPAIDLASLRALPCLLLSGELDTDLRRAASAAYTEALPQARSFVLRGAGHLACLDAPHDYAAAVSEFARLTARLT
jgi:3-oxoadipate enol-lactonase